MTQPPTEKPSPQRPLLLDYAPPDPNRPVGGVTYPWQIALGFASSAAAGFLALVITILSRGGPEMLLMSGALMFLILMSSGVAAHDRWKWRGFLLGICIGIVVVVLGLGLCFVLVIRSF